MDMRKFVTALVVIPLGIFFVIFAVANRHLVTVSFDPFNSVTPTVAVTLPLFVVIIAVAILGVLAGGMASWFRQGKWRRAARQHEAEAQRVRSQLADLRNQVARDGQQRFPALAPGGQGGNQGGMQGGIYGSAGRDKQGAAL
jgi:uncharacterized integral membrane protein